MDDSYTVLGQSKITRSNPVTRKAETGWIIPYKDNLTGVHSEVWVPEQNYPDAVDGIIKAELQSVRYVHSLGTIGA